MTVKRVIECDYCKKQEVIDDHHIYMNYPEWITIYHGKPNEDVKHYCSNKCMIDSVNKEVIADVVELTSGDGEWKEFEYKEKVEE